MYGGFWYHIRHAFDHKDNGLYKIIAINLLAFLVLMVARVFLTIGGAEEVYRSILSYLMMPASVPRFLMQPWTLISYMFLHEGFLHIIFNLLFLYWFGLLVQEYLGNRKLVNLYFLGGIAGGLLYMVLYNIAPYFSDRVDGALMLGASAGVYAIVVAAATLRPDTHFHLLLIGPVKIKYIAIFYVLVAFANSAGANAGGELAHLGGAALGYIYILQLNKGVDLGKPVQAVGQFFEKLFSAKPKVKVTYRRGSESGRSASGRSRSTGATSGSSSTQEEIDRILDKIAEKGYDNLSKEEKRKLFDFSNKDV
ncbi:Membrane associated serine protease, rhomboid family [Cyclobacterium lianum]|uniref:Membrane associated serine protease, rhomboid family n=1 Tax=Cyclobacterium lianum TaxID=388280 RepID=A0A1M7JJS4_9BACT|nr:rhomboid family intramembrane serine protease [Cyclobacterium lianum]SHM52757.1 Membrane associated serine protease, rhomboid family [Cyclobacterium lianum]